MVVFRDMDDVVVRRAAFVQLIQDWIWPESALRGRTLDQGD